MAEQETEKGLLGDEDLERVLFVWGDPVVCRMYQREL